MKIEQRISNFIPALVWVNTNYEVRTIISQYLNGNSFLNQELRIYAIL